MLDWAKLHGHRDGENPARWRGHLALIFPAIGKVQRVEHHKAVPDRRPACCVAKTWTGRGTIEAQAVQFTILTAARPGDVQQAVWDEIDFDGACWHLSPDKNKGGRIPSRTLTSSRWRSCGGDWPTGARARNWSFPVRGKRAARCRRGHPRGPQGRQRHSRCDRARHGPLDFRRLGQRAHQTPPEVHRPRTGPRAKGQNQAGLPTLRSVRGEQAPDGRLGSVSRWR